MTSRQRILSRRPAPPTRADAEAAYLDLARRHVVVGGDELLADVARRLGVPAGDPLLAELDAVTLDPDGPLLLLPPDVVVHGPALMAGASLTHRLTEQEVSDGFLLLDADLAGFARLDEVWDGDEPLECDDTDEGPAWFGAEDWLAELPAGTLLAVTVDDRGGLTLTPLDEPPAAPPGMVERLRAVYDEELAEPGLPVPAEHLLLGMRRHDRAAFTEPAPPLVELAAAAGLERRRAEFAHAASVWAAGEEADRHWRLIDRLGPGGDATVALEVLDLLAAGDTPSLRGALDRLDSPDVVEAVTEELLEADTEALTDLADRLIAVAGRSSRAAVARWMAAVAAERVGRVLDAESHLRAAVSEAPGWEFVEDRLAWYEADRGDAVAAAGRWRSIGTDEDHPDLVFAARFAHAPDREPGRNDPCPCGSGRKYKQCHLGRPVGPPLPQRAGWLWRKAIGYLERYGAPAQDVVVDCAAVRAGESGDLESALHDPITVDVALHEEGWFARFLRDRGPLLPEDEARLGASWLAVDRSVYEVLAVRDGAGLDLRDLRTDAAVTVTERTVGHAVGMLLCARAVPDGEGHQFVGGVLPVPPGRERSLLDRLDEGPGEYVLAFAAARAAPSRTLDGAGHVARLRVGGGAADILDEAYLPAGAGWVDVDENDQVLATLDLDGVTLTIRTTAETDLDALLADLRIELPEGERLPEP